MQQLLDPDFSATEALRYALDKFNEDAGYCCGFLGLIELVCLAASAVLSFHCVLAAQLLFQLDSPPPESYLSLAFLVIYFCLRCPCQLVINRWFLLLLDGQHVSYDELFSFNFLSQVPLVLRLAAASIICSCYTLLGTILLVFPGVFAASTLRFYKFLIIDRDADAVQALRQSYEICGESKGQLVGLSLRCPWL